MKKYRWLRIKTINEEEDLLKLRLNDIFLTGESVIGQLENKNIGDEISYYKIIKKEEKNIEYITIFDFLEED